MQKIRSWDEMDLVSQKDEFAKQALAYEFVQWLKQWLRNYVRMARALADAFDEDPVLDILEQTWWELQYEAGRTWRAEFDADPEAAFEAMYHRWHEGAQGLTGGVQDVTLEGTRWEILVPYCKHREVALEMGERKILISQCMSDMAAVRGWCPRVIMRFPNALLRGDPYCYQIRELVDQADPSLDHWTKELSEKCGWRSIARLED
jgi:hypothetical protein